MRTGPVSAFLIALLANISVLAQSPDLPADIGVTVNEADQSRLGLSTLHLRPVEMSDTAAATARVLDVGGLASLNAEIDSAQAAATASGRDAERLQLLVADDLNASRQSLESAQARALADSARLRLARQRVALEWGAGLAGLGDAGRRRLVDQIVAGEAALLRVDPLQTAAPVAGTVRLEISAGHPATETRSLGFAASTDPRLQTSGLLVILRGDSAATMLAGRLVAAEIDTGERLVGVVLPRESLIRADGRTWAYLRRDRERFVRREVLDARLTRDGWFVSMHFAVGDELVTVGSESLFAIERSDEAIEAE